MQTSYTLTVGVNTGGTDYGFGTGYGALDPTVFGAFTITGLFARSTNDRLYLRIGEGALAVPAAILWLVVGDVAVPLSKSNPNDSFFGSDEGFPDATSQIIGALGGDISVTLADTPNVIPGYLFCADPRDLSTVTLKNGNVIASIRDKFGTEDGAGNPLEAVSPFDDGPLRVGRIPATGEGSADFFGSRYLELPMEAKIKPTEGFTVIHRHLLGRGTPGSGRRVYTTGDSDGMRWEWSATQRMAMTLNDTVYFGSGNQSSFDYNSFRNLYTSGGPGATLEIGNTTTPPPGYSTTYPASPTDPAPSANLPQWGTASLDYGAFFMVFNRQLTTPVQQSVWDYMGAWTAEFTLQDLFTSNENFGLYTPKPDTVFTTPLLNELCEVGETIGGLLDTRLGVLAVPGDPGEDTGLAVGRETPQSPSIYNLGSEQVVNGDFETGDFTGWRGSTGFWQIVDNAAFHPVSANYNSLVTDAFGLAGKWVELRFDVTSYSGDTGLRVALRRQDNTDLPIADSPFADASTVGFPGIRETGTFVWRGRVPDDFGSFVFVRNGSGGTGSSFTIDNVSAREIPGNHAYQATEAERPVFGQDASDKHYMAAGESNRHLEIYPSVTVPQPATVLVAAQFTGDAPGESGILYRRDTNAAVGFRSDSDGGQHALRVGVSLLSTQTDNNAPFYRIDTFNNPNSTLNFNGTVVAQGETGGGSIVVANAATFRIGSQGNRVGDPVNIYELAVLDRLLTAEERADVENYLGGYLSALAPGEDNRFLTYAHGPVPVTAGDARFPAPGQDTEHDPYPTDGRFPAPGQDNRFP